MNAAEIIVKTRERRKPESERSNSHQIPTERATSVAASSR